MIFYIVLAALFAICMKGLLSTINDDNPKWQLEESIIGEEPGLTFRPFYPDDPHELIPLIKFATDSQEDITKWTSNLDQFLDGTSFLSDLFNETVDYSHICISQTTKRQTQIEKAATLVVEIILFA